jgi:hypothetical protein
MTTTGVRRSTASCRVNAGTGPIAVLRVGGMSRKSARATA